MTRSPLALLVLLAAACHGGRAAPAAPAPTFLSSPEGRALGLPFSEAVRAGGFLFVSGQVGNRPGTMQLVPGGLPAEAAQALDNIAAVLARHGASLADVVKCTVFLADIREWPAFNEVYRTRFRAPYPARSALAASGLALDARVEVECIAWAPTDGR